MHSPQKSLSRGAATPSKKKSNYGGDFTPSEVQPRSTTSHRAKQPFIQDTLNRLTSPYKTSTDSSAKLMSAVPFEFPSKSGFEDVDYPVKTPKKQKNSIQSSRTRPSTTDQFRSPRRETPGVFPSQVAVEGNLKDGLTTLKLVVRENEEKGKEKKVLQKVVDQLRIQIEGLKSRKTNFTKNFEKLHKDSLLNNDAAATKENHRKLISKDIEQVKSAVITFDKEIQESISQNVEVANRIKEEQFAILKLKEKIADIKNKIAIETRDKEKARSDLQVSSKQLKSCQQKYEAFAKEKGSYIETIKGSKVLKK